jgi:hypothetical protein
VAGRIRNHLRSNLIGYVALFIGLGGSAYAAAEIGSDDIRRNAVISKHLRKNAVTSQDIRNRKGVTSRDVKDATLRSSDVKDHGLRTKDVAGLDALIARVARLEARANALGSDVAALQGLTGVGSGVDGTIGSLDSRLDALCEQADAVNQEFNDLTGAADVLLDVSGVNLPNFDPAACQG